MKAAHPLFRKAALQIATLVWIVGADASALSVEVGTSFTGKVAATPGGAPPDTMGAVGEDHVVELLNGGFSVYAKQDGTLLERSASLNAFWESTGVTPIGGTFDPRVLYDSSSGRWFALAVDGALQPGGLTEVVTNRFLLAVSETSDPTQGWSGFAIDADATDVHWADFPMLGVDADALYLSGGMFTVSGGTRVSSNTFVVLPKSDLLAPVPSIANATSFEQRGLNVSGFVPTPVVNQDGGGLPGKFYAGGITNFGQIQVSRIDGPLVSPTWTGGGFIAVESLPVPPLADQPGPKLDIDTFDTRFGNVVRSNGIDWAVQNVEIDGNAAVRWFQIDPENDIVLDSGVIADPVLDLFYPSIAVNEFDEIVIAMSGSSEADFAGAYAVAGAKIGGVTEFGDLIRLQPGLADYERVNGNPPRNRWGDYSATVVDPTNPHHFWTFQEYVHAEDTHAIWITELILVPEPGTVALLALGVGVLALRRSASASS
jgi:hypothetical protein